MNRHSIIGAALLVALLAPRPVLAQGPAPDAALAAAVQAAVIERLGASAEVRVTSLDLASEEDFELREVRLDSVARLGKPMRVTFITDAGRQVRAMTTLAVTVDHVVMRAPVRRAQELTADDVEAVRAELVGVPLRPLPVAADVVGGRTLRPIAEGAVIEMNFVSMPRVVEPGDLVVVMASVGAVQVSASLIAVDGGQVGDVIRVSNRDTRRYVKARILDRGLAEVIHDR